MTHLEFSDAVDALLRGEEPAPGLFAALSDLDRSNAAALRAAWLAIPPATRETVVSEASLLALGEVGYDFERLMTGALEDPEPSVRRHAAAALGESTAREPVEALVRLVAEDPDPAVRTAAAASLVAAVTAWAGHSRFTEALDRIVAALRQAAGADPAVEVRARALVTVAGTGAGWVAPLIEEAYYGDDRELRLAAIEAMGQTFDDSWLEFLLEALASDDEEFRAEAVQACGDLGSEDAIEPLAALVGDDDPDVAALAIGAIARIGGPVAVEYLNDLRADPPPGVDLELLDAALVEAKEAAGETMAEEAE